jgi:hypothetical protein
MLMLIGYYRPVSKEPIMNISIADLLTIDSYIKKTGEMFSSVQFYSEISEEAKRAELALHRIAKQCNLLCVFTPIIGASNESN